MTSGFDLGFRRRAKRMAGGVGDPTSSVDTRHFLARGAIFSELDDEMLDELSVVARRLRVSAGTRIFAQGDAGEGVYFIADGSVKVEAECADRRRMIVNVLGTGEVFGEMALFGSRSRSATVTTLEDSEILVIERGRFLELLESSPRLAHQLLLSLSGRLRRLTELVEAIRPVL